MDKGIGDPDRLYKLLPALYRERDEQEGYALRDLLRLVTEQADIVHTDIGLLWDNFFIETCARWAIPYIGDLVGNKLLHDAEDPDAYAAARALFPDLAGPDLRPANAIRTRADVGKTIYYRRRKGTLPMLEELARDVTGWAAHAVEFFELLIWNQNLNHLRMHSCGCPDLRRPQEVDRLGGAFDFMSHTVDVRYPRQDEGWYNIRNIGFFLWRLRAHRMEKVVARQGALPWQYHISPLGNAAPLFSRLRREGDEAGLATELHVPGPIRPAAFFDAPGEFYGLASNASFAIFRDGAPVPLAQVRCRDLASWTQPAGSIVAVDVRRGRIAFGNALVPAAGVDVHYHYGFSADLGGGPYPRANWLVAAGVPALRLEVIEGGAAPRFPTLDDALAEWVNQGRPNAAITILDNRSYALTLPLALADGAFLVIEAGNERRPHLLPAGGVLEVGGTHPGAELTLSGLLVEGAVHVTGELQTLRLLHSTLVPGRSLDQDGAPATNLPSIVVEDLDGGGVTINAGFRLQAAFSITGPLRLPHHAEGISLLDSIVDGLGTAAIAATNTSDAPGPPATLERVTIFGPSFYRKLPLASEVVFTGPAVAEQRQDGCVRFSFVPHPSLTPRRHRCQPELEVATRIEHAERSGPLSAAQKAALVAQVRARVLPSFTSVHYGDPGYAQLHLSSPVEIRTGAGDGAEMGVFCHLKQPQRETNLRIRLEEYLPFGLDPGVIYVT
jgi:hypothetical protein